MRRKLAVCPGTVPETRPRHVVVSHKHALDGIGKPVAGIGVGLPLVAVPDQASSTSGASPVSRAWNRSGFGELLAFEVSVGKGLDDG